MADTASAAEHSPRSVAVMNQKGGVGKTTTAVNLGAAIAESGRRICLIDLDPQAHLTLHLGIDHEQIKHTTYDLLVDTDCPAAHCVVSAAENLDVIPAEVDLAAAESELAGQPDRQRILTRKFAAIADLYDAVLIDCPPSLGLLTLNALALAKEVLVPLQAHFLALQGVGKLLETIRLVCQSVNPDLRVAGPAAYELYGVAVPDLRNKLFAMTGDNGEEALVATACLTAIDELRDEHGYVDSEPRHPDIKAGRSWPLEIPTEKEDVS